MKTFGYAIFLCAFSFIVDNPHAAYVETALKRRLSIGRHYFTSIVPREYDASVDVYITLGFQQVLDMVSLKQQNFDVFIHDNDHDNPAMCKSI